MLFLFFSVSVQAQMSKAEKKKWKTELKKYKKDLGQFRDLVEDYNSMQGKINGYESKIEALEGRLTEKDSKISDLQGQLDNAQGELAAAKRKISEMSAAPKPKPVDNDNYEEGVVFKVQVGAFKNNDLSEYADTQEEFNMDTDGELQKYTLGVFRDYWEADKFKKYLRKMGVKEAWIVSYQDGVRVPIKDVLEGLI
jgi:chromosome segregation ATPase